MEKINYTIIRSPKRKTASIVIRADNRVEVLAPSHMPATLIDTFVQQKSAWIANKLHFNQEIRSTYIPKQFESGESFHLLGQPYTLHILQAKRAIQISEHNLLVSHPSPEPQTTCRQIERWYRQQAESYIQTRSDHFATMIGRQPRSIGIKAYKSRWGSCHHDGRIYINWRLIMAPAWVVDYVIAHELCHLIHLNHGTGFKTLLQSIYPNHLAAKSWIKINGLTLSL